MAQPSLEGPLSVHEWVRVQLTSVHVSRWIAYTDVLAQLDTQMTLNYSMMSSSGNEETILFVSIETVTIRLIRSMMYLGFPASRE